MKKVKKQIEFLEDLLKELKKKCRDRSSWKKSTLPNRITETKAIQEGVNFLIALVKRASP